MTTIVEPSEQDASASHSLRTMISQLSFTTEPTEEEQTEKHPIHNFFTGGGGLFCLSFDDQELFYDAMDDHDEFDRCIDDGCPHNNTLGGRKSASCPSFQVVPDLRSASTTSSIGTGAERDMTTGDLHVPYQPHNKDETEMSQSYSPEELLYEQSRNVTRTHRALPPPLLQDHHDLRPKEQLAPPPNNPFSRLLGPEPPLELPDRFLRAGKGNPEEGQRRYEATLEWRKENGIDTILVEPHPDFELIKSNYPHYYHLRGRNNEPVFFELPPKTNLQAMRDGGVTLPGLLRHYAMVTEFQWQFIERDDFAKSITVVDLDGMRMMDFVGECVEYVRSCSDFTGQHFPERAGFVLVINAPGWFAMIWNVVKPMVDEVTLKKINILRGNKEEVLEALLEKIDIKNIPSQYGGESMPLGESPQEHLLRDLMKHNNKLVAGDHSCGGRAADPPCPFCSFVPARSY